MKGIRSLIALGSQLRNPQAGNAVEGQERRRSFSSLSCAISYRFFR
jgi:hypothetical protein